jgi:hypothetical protein
VGRFLGGRPAPTRPAIDTLEAEIAAEHHEAAAGFRPFADELEAVRNRPAMQPDGSGSSRPVCGWFTEGFDTPALPSLENNFSIYFLAARQRQSDPAIP